MKGEYISIETSKIMADIEKENKELHDRIDKAIDYIDKLLYFGIRNENIDLNEIKLYLTKNNYKDITLRNLENYGNNDDEIIKYEEIEDFIKNELKGE